MKKRIGLVGGSCVDIFATSALPLIAHDSNPGTVNIGFGGVGRNIAENLARLSQEVLLFAPFGQDPVSAHMMAYTAAAGVDISHCLVAPNSEAPYYISINDVGGEMAVAVNDMAICKQISPDYLMQKLDILNTCDAIFFDTNIPKDSIDTLVEYCKPPLLAEAVSTHKAAKLVSALPYLHAIKANRQEAQALTGLPVSVERLSLQAAADTFHRLGIPHVLITLGKQGAFYSANGIQLRRNAYQTTVENTNGCGDAFCAAAFLGIIKSSTPESLLDAALAAAAITAQSKQSVSADMSLAAIETFFHKARRNS